MDTGVQGYRDTEIQGYMDTGIQGYMDTGIYMDTRGFRDTGIHLTGIQGIWIQACRDTGIH